MDRERGRGRERRGEEMERLDCVSPYKNSFSLNLKYKSDYFECQRDGRINSRTDRRTNPRVTLPKIVPPAGTKLGWLIIMWRF